MPRNIPDSPFAVDQRRCEPVCREHQHGHRPHGHAGDSRGEGSVGETQELRQGSEGRFQLSVVGTDLNSFWTKADAGTWSSVHRCMTKWA